MATASLLIPLLAIEYGAGPLLIGLMAATAALAGVPGALLWGWIAARTGRRRPFLLVALGATTGVLLSVPFLRSPSALLLATGVLWFAITAAAPVLNLIVVEGREEWEWDSRIARLHTVQGYAWAAGLVLGTLWTSTTAGLLPPATSKRWLFYLLAAVATVAGMALARWYPERPTISVEGFRDTFRRLHRRDWRAGRSPVSVPFGPARVFWALTSLSQNGGRRWFSPGRFNPRLWRYLLAVGWFSMAFGILWGPMPAYLKGEGLSAGAVFLLYLVANLASAGSYGRVGVMAHSRGPRRLQVLALSFRAVVIPAIGIVGRLGVPLFYPLIAVLFAAIGITWAAIVVTSTGLVTRLAPDIGRSEALGVHTAVAGIGVGTGSVLGGWSAGALGYEATFTLSGVVVLAAVGLVLRSDALVGPPGTE